MTENASVYSSQSIFQFLSFRQSERWWSLIFIHLPRITQPFLVFPVMPNQAMEVMPETLGTL